MFYGCNYMHIVVIGQGCLCLYRKFQRNQSSSTLLIFKLTVLADVGEVSVFSSHQQLRLRFKEKIEAHYQVYRLKGNTG